ncbi:MAG: DNRLRE domain-containing protein [Ignavibacteriales bacterium]|nr:DNRLRE domain-containing protein [Ignavibacteriales bacterium]
MKYINYIFILAIIIAGILPGCSDDPGILGTGMISPYDTLSVATTELFSTADTSFLYRFSGTSHIMVGKYSTGGSNIESRGLMQFSEITSVPDSAIIDTAYVTLNLNYSVPDTIGNIRFGIYEMNVNWDQSTFLWDSLDGSYNPTVKYDFQQSFTGLKNINIPIDSLAEKWVRNKIDKPNGILLVPGLDGSDIIIGSRFLTLADKSPKLTIAYHITGDTIKHFIKNAVQTTFVSNAAIPIVDTTILVQSGIGYRGKIQFNLNSLPKHISITRAILELSSDTSDPLSISRTHDSLLVHLIRKNYYPFDSTALGTLCSPVIKNGYKIYRADIKTIVQSWLVREPNHGLLIRPYSENYSFDHFSIFNNKAASQLKPKLSIIYTKLP